MSFNEPSQASCEALTGGSEKTVTLDVVNYLRVDSGINDIVYVKFNWASGDTEVSSTNFDVRIPASGDFEFASRHNNAPRLFNARVLCATSGRVAFWGW